MKYATILLSAALMIANVGRAGEPAPPAPGSAEYMAQIHAADEKANLADGLVSGYPFEIPTVASNRFAEGDGLLITTVRGTQPTFAVGGRYLIEGVYKLSTLPRALLLTFVTTPGLSGFTQDEPAQRCRIKGPNGHFVLQLPVGRPGLIRLAIYPLPHGEFAGGLYLQDARPAQNVAMQFSSLPQP
jgi:hypothetical protein